MNEILVNDGPILNDHLKIIRSVSWILHKSSGYDLEDLFSEGCLQYLLKRNKFCSTNNTKATTFIWCVVKNSLLDYLKAQPSFISAVSSEFMESLARDFLGTSCDNHRVREKFLENAY